MGVTLLVALLVTQAPAESGSPPAGALRVTSVELRLPPDTDASLVADAPELVAVRKGQELTRRAVRRTIERLIETGRFADVVVRGTPNGPDGVDIVIDASPLRSIAEVYVEGNRAIATRQLVAATRLETGAELSVERLVEAEEAIRTEYRRKGYRRALVVSQRLPAESKVDVLFSVVEGEPTRLTQMTFAGEQGLPVERLTTAMQLQLGAVVEQSQVDEGLERLREVFRREHFYRARLDEPMLSDDGQLQVPLHSGPRLSLKVEGHETYAESVLLGVSGYDGTEPLEQALIDRMALKLRDWYRFNGFHDARVKPKAVRSADGANEAVVLVVTEGQRLVVTQLDFEGNAAVTRRELMAVLKEVMVSAAPVPVHPVPRLGDGLEVHGRYREPAWRNPTAQDPETVLVEEAWQQAASAMRALYRDRGYLRATVALAPFELSTHGARAAFVVQEGPRADYRSVTVMGAPEGVLPSNKSWLPLGEPFSARAVESARQQIQRELETLGYLFARVEAKYQVEDDVKAHVSFVVTPGPRVQVGKVIVRGLRRTVESVVRGQVLLKEGAPLKPDDLIDTQRNLIGLGIFRTAEVRLLSPETLEPVKDVLIELAEAPRLSGEVSPGYFYAEGPRLVVDAQYPNLGGRAISLQARALVNLFALSAPAISRVVDTSRLSLYEQIGFRANISAFNRGLLPLDIGSRIDLVGERVFRPSYFFTRAAVVPGLDWPTTFRLPFIDFARLKMTVLLQYELEVSAVQASPSVSNFPLLGSDQERLRFSYGTFALQTVRLTQTLELRDDPISPHKGFLLQGSIERTGHIYAVDQNSEPVTVQFIKVSGLATAYIPIASRVTLALSVRGGRIFRTAAGSVTPPVKRFFMGGVSTIRGFQEDNLIAEDARAKLRGEVANCQALAQGAGCTQGATALSRGLNVASQGGEFFYLGKAELRTPLFLGFDLGIFGEAGNLWLDTPTVFSVRPVVGLGVRYSTSFATLALDLGFNLMPDQTLNEPVFVPHFNVGVF